MTKQLPENSSNTSQYLLLKTLLLNQSNNIKHLISELEWVYIHCSTADKLYLYAIQKRGFHILRIYDEIYRIILSSVEDPS